MEMGRNCHNHAMKTESLNESCCRQLVIIYSLCRLHTLYTQRAHTQAAEEELYKIGTNRYVVI